MRVAVGDEQRALVDGQRHAVARQDQGIGLALAALALRRVLADCIEPVAGPIGPIGAAFLRVGFDRRNKHGRTS